MAIYTQGQWVVIKTGKSLDIQKYSFNNFEIQLYQIGSYWISVESLFDSFYK